MEQTEWDWWNDNESKPGRRKPTRKYIIDGVTCRRTRLVTLCKRVLGCSRRAIKGSRDTELLNLLRDSGYSARREERIGEMAYNS